MLNVLHDRSVLEDKETMNHCVRENSTAALSGVLQNENLAAAVKHLGSWGKNTR